MFSLTLRTTPEAKLPMAARHSCAHSPLRGGLAAWRTLYRGPAAGAAASSLELQIPAIQNPVFGCKGMIT